MGTGREKTGKETLSHIREWLKAKITERGYGTQAELANYLSVNPNAISKMLKPQAGQGYRTITAEELVKMARFFGEAPPCLSLRENLPEHDTLITLFEQISPEQRQLILALLKNFTAEKQKK